ncbi:hypothetical protein LPB140_02455 [Sphingorhabdus lutea]|uniref:DUF3617 family protein n=1 Tax=Sphingorhabdus lutea TaxID=1913578 RepID=A0A1L3J9T2_9SPHN|nr:hypothetical protein [Sphingorhabdus lutea]APG61874.1 hypothetical protein LPB140_02455 [Sphingorhabdus lutea]
MKLFLFHKIMPSLFLGVFLLPAHAAHAQNEENAKFSEEEVKAMMQKWRNGPRVDADGCIVQSKADEIVVCGESEENRENRLPFPNLNRRATGPVRGEMPAASAAPLRTGSCGVSGNISGCANEGPYLNADGSVAKGMPIVDFITRAAGISKEPINDGDYVKQSTVTKP